MKENEFSEKQIVIIEGLRIEVGISKEVLKTENYLRTTFKPFAKFLDFKSDFENKTKEEQKI